MFPKILYEDNELLVIDKPAGMVVNRAESVKGETVQDWVERYLKIPSTKREILNKSKIKNSIDQKGLGFRDLDLEFSSRAGVVHRIDKETSGVLLIAKTPEAFENLQAQFKERKVEKTYVALVHGRVFPVEGEIKGEVGRLPWNRERFGVLAGGREALTRYRVISNFKFLISNEELSLLELHPKTGRTHQVRVHLKSIGHPIVGDEFYAGRKTSRVDRKWCPRLFLHAKMISFNQPASGDRMTIESQLPEELSNVLGGLSRS
ncbi:RluA family pseudouridine synthase [Candidatus Microgenomates bacterium]|nr:RluA family pseudouridine synthase [Candidatus Microgenomates bacterium]